MADAPAPHETKPFDRKRPFKRINNDAFVPKDKPDGRGERCGCHTPPADYSSFEAEFLRALHDEAPAFATLLDVLEKVKAVARAVGEIAKWAKLFPPAFLIALTVEKIANVVELVVTIIDTALRKFLARLAHRMFRRAIRVLPQWVPVQNGSPKSRITAEQIVEVEGVVTRSFGNPIDVPFVQWHRWFDWNIQVRPEARYQKVISIDDPPNTAGWSRSERSLFRPGSVEIQLDAGALWHPGSAQAAALRTGLARDDVKNGRLEDIDWPPQFTDLCWPSTDMWVWAAGRWVYDCSRTTLPEDPTRRGKPEDPRMVAMLNPCKAIATARWKAVKFLQNEFAVPAIQFMFFTTKRGGYLDHATISDQDYEFLLDLPPLDPRPASPFPIGQESLAPHNTILVRPRLLHRVDKGMFEQFAGARGPDPIITVIRPDDPDRPPTQVRVKVPCTALGDAEAYGFILSLGWHDPLLEQARKVKACTVKVTHYTGSITDRESGIKKIRAIFAEEEKELRAEIAREVARQVSHIEIIPGVPISSIPGAESIIQDMIDAALKEFLDTLQDLLKLEDDEWLLRVGVNGEWQRIYIDSVPTKVTNPNPAGGHLLLPQPLPKPLEFGPLFVEEGEPLRISAHGMAFDPVGDIMWSSENNRTLRLDGSAVDWSTICDPSPDPEEARRRRRRLALRYAIKTLTDSTSTALALGLDNAPLGIVEPDPRQSGPSPVSNPIEVKTAEPGFKDGEQQARFARAVDDQMILVEDARKDDYWLFYSVEIKKQVPA